MNRDSTVRIIRSRFDNVEERSSGIVRAEKRRDGKTMSVHYFDFSEVLAEEEFDLQTYLQQSFASDFYKTEGSLQWNYYLYFVVDKLTFGKISESPILKQIESDRTFARKFVRAQTELNTDLDSPFVETFKVGTVSQDIASLWTEELKNAELGKVADPAAEYAKAVRDYLDGTTEAAKRAVTVVPFVGRMEKHLPVRDSKCDTVARNRLSGVRAVVCRFTAVEIRAGSEAIRGQEIICTVISAALISSTPMRRLNSQV